MSNISHRPQSPLAQNTNCSLKASPEELHKRRKAAGPRRSVAALPGAALAMPPCAGAQLLQALTAGSGHRSTSQRAQVALAYLCFNCRESEQQPPRDLLPESETPWEVSRRSWLLVPRGHALATQPLSKRRGSCREDGREGGTVWHVSDTTNSSWSSSAAALLGQRGKGRRWHSSVGASGSLYVMFVLLPCSVKVCLHPGPALQAELWYSRCSRRSKCRQPCWRWGRGTLPVPAQWLPAGSGASRGLWALGEGGVGAAEGDRTAKPFMSLLPHRRGRALALSSATQEGNELQGKNDSQQKYYPMARSDPCELCSCGQARSRGAGPRRAEGEEGFDPALAAAQRKAQREQTRGHQRGRTPQPRRPPPDAAGRGWHREYVSSHSSCLFQDCERYKAVSVTVILAGKRGSSSLLFYTCIFWTPTESY